MELADKKFRNLNHINHQVKYSVLVPAYNEEQGLAVVLERLNQILDSSFEVLVIDDGSQDNTSKVATTYGCKVIVHSVNKGKGAAIMSGVSYAQADGLIFIDADGTYPPEAILTIAEHLNLYDMVVAKRKDRDNIHFINRIGNRVFEGLLRILYKSKISDPLSGLYGIRKKCLVNMHLNSKGFEIETELNIKAARMALSTWEIPIAYNKRVGETKLHPFRDGYLILRTIFTLMFLYNPTYSFTIPGLLLLISSLALHILLLRGPVLFGGITLSIHASIFSGMLALTGMQIAVFGVASKLYAILHKFAHSDVITDFFIRKNIGKFLIGISLASIIFGLILICRIIFLWVKADFTSIFQINAALFAFLPFILGIQLLFSNFFLSIFYKELAQNHRLPKEQDEVTKVIEPVFDRKGVKQI